MRLRGPDCYEKSYRNDQWMRRRQQATAAARVMKASWMSSRISQILLVGGDKSGDWSGWSRRAIPQAEELYTQYVKEREEEEGQR